MEFCVFSKDINGVMCKRVLPDGFDGKCIEYDYRIVLNSIQSQMPTGCTMFSQYRDGVGIIEIYDGPRDHKSVPIWRGTFRTPSVQDIRAYFN